MITAFSNSFIDSLFLLITSLTHFLKKSSSGQLIFSSKAGSTVLAWLIGERETLLISSDPSHSPKISHRTQAASCLFIAIANFLF